MSWVSFEHGKRALEMGAYSQAYEIFKAAVYSGEDPAYYGLCDMALQGKLSNEQITELKDMLQKAVREHNGSATYNLAVLLSRAARGFDLDLAKAIDLFNQACGQRIPEAYLALARLYVYDGRNHPLATKPNIVQLLETAMKMGQAEAACLLGKIHYSKELTKNPDVSKAVVYFVVAGQLGSDEAKRALVVLQTEYAGINFDRELNQAKTTVRAIKNKAFEEKYESSYDSSSSW